MGRLDCPDGSSLQGNSQIQEWPTLKGSTGCAATRRGLRSRRGLKRQQRPRRVVRKEVEPALDSNSATKIVEMMTESIDDVYQQEFHMLALRKLAQSAPAFQDDIRKAGGIQAILASMKVHFADEPFQVLSVDVIGHVVVANLASTLTFVSLGGVQLLIDDMQQYQSVVLQEASCKLLRHVILCNPECQELVGASGAVKAVLQAMSEHAAMVSLQEQGCRILKELGAFHTSNQERIFQSGGIPVVLQAMKNHVQNHRVQEVACGVLRNMTACNAQYQNEIVSCGGITLVLDAMSEHSGAANVQWACCWLFFCLGVHNTQSKIAITHAGVVRAVLSTMNEHRNDPRVQEAGCWFLKEMASNIAQEQDQIMLTAGIQTILKAMERHTEEKKVQVAASGALQQFSAHDVKGRVRAISLGRCGRLGRNSTMHVLSVIEE